MRHRTVRRLKDRIVTELLIDIRLSAKMLVAKTFGDVLTAGDVARLVNAVRDQTPRCAALKTNGRYRADPDGVLAGH